LCAGSGRSNPLIKAIFKGIASVVASLQGKSLPRNDENSTTISIRKFFLCFFCLLNGIAFGQATDSVPEFSKQHITYTIGLDESKDINSNQFPVDTTLSEIRWFDPVDRDDFLFRNTGNLGSAHFPLICCPEQEMGLQMGYQQFSLYRFTKDNIRFYQNRRPYTHLQMLIGQRKEQIFQVEHSQNIKKKFNFGFHFKRFATQGAYVRQQTRHNDIAFTTRYDSKKRYLLKTLLIFNNTRADENGGIKNTGIFNDTSFMSKQLVEVELEEAESKRKDIYFQAYQSWALGTQPDSISSPKWSLYHEIDVGRERYEYNEAQPDSEYYGLFYNDDSLVNDYVSKAEKLNFGSKLGVKKIFKQNHRLDISTSYTFNIIEQDGLEDAHLQNLDANVSFLRDTSERLSYGISMGYSFLDYNKDDLKFNAFYAYNYGKAGKFQVDISYTKTEPAWLYHRFSFGGISWENDFDKQAILSARLAYSLPKYSFHISTQFHRIDGLIYTFGHGRPGQMIGGQEVLVFELHKLFRIRYFGFDNLLRVQIASDKSFLRYPVYWGVHSLFYERGVFKGKLLTRVGADIRYNTNYKAYGYFPLTGQFRLQEAETLKFYPVMDVYLSFKIQTVRLFLIMNHVNQGMFGDKGFFSAYKYPADDRHFRFSVSWMFLD